MKKLSILLGVLLVIALAFGIVTVSQKGDLQKQVDTLTAAKNDAETALTAAKNDGEAALTAAKEEAEAALAAAKDEAETALTAAKNDGEAALAAAKEEAEAALTAAKEELETKVAELTAAKDEAVAAAKEEAEAAAAAVAEEVEAQIAALNSEKEEAEKALAAATDNAADLEGQVAALTKLLNADYTGKTVILHSNDVHGALDGYAYIPTLRRLFTNMGAEKVLVADAGDFSQGTIYVSTNQGAAAIDMMNAAGYNVVTLGNHEFDFGYAQLLENLTKAEFKTICSNVIVDETGEAILDSGVIVNFVPLKSSWRSSRMRLIQTLL